MRRVHRAWHAVAAAVVGSSAACTLVPGWSDLQDGQPDAGRGEEDETGAPERDGAVGDESAQDAATNVACGAVTCTGTQGCCIQFGSAQRGCTPASDCPVGGGTAWLTCNDGTGCPKAQPHCCLSFTEGLATCQNGCAPGDKVLCDPSSASQSQCPIDFPACIDDTFNTADLFSCE